MDRTSYREDSVMALFSKRQTRFERQIATQEHPLVKWGIISVSLLFFVMFLVLPLATVFFEALRRGLAVYFESIVEPDALAAVRLTVLAAAISVPLNLVFGVAAAWSISKFDFPGKQLLVTFIDLPFSVSPVVVGLMYMMLLGANSWLGSWLIENGITVIFAVP